MRLSQFEATRKILVITGLYLIIVQKLYIYIYEWNVNSIYYSFLAPSQMWPLYLALVLLSVAIFLSGWNFADLLLCGFGIYSTVASGQIEFAALIFLVIAARNLDLRQLIQAWFVINAAVMSFCVVSYPILYFLGSPYAEVTINDRIRYHFFFCHANVFGAYFAFVVLAFFYLYRDRLAWWVQSLVLIAAVLFEFYFPKCRTGAILLALYAFILVVRKFSAKLTEIGLWTGVLGSVSLAILAPVGYYFGVIPQTEKIINVYFSCRFLDAAVALKLFRFNFFGQMLTAWGQSVTAGEFSRVVWFDLAYLRIFVYFGIVGGLIFLGGMLAGFALLMKKRKIDEAIMLLMVFLSGLTEWHGFSIAIAFPLLFLRDVFDVRFAVGRYGRRGSGIGGPEEKVRGAE